CGAGVSAEAMKPALRRPSARTNAPVTRRRILRWRRDFAASAAEDRPGMSPSEARGGDELICIPFFMSGRTGRQGAAWAFSWLTDEINRGKQRDPNDVDEVPVIRNDDGCSGLRRRELADL